MSVTSVDADYDNLRVTLIADFDASIDRVWELWSDPRKLERWWGPPGFPATVEAHDLTPGGEVRYLMRGPEGDVHHGVWRISASCAPKLLGFTDSFADPDWTPKADMPVSTVSVRLAERGAGTRMELHLTFESREDMQRVVETGTVDGLRQAIGQADVLLAA